MRACSRWARLALPLAICLMTTTGARAFPVKISNGSLPSGVSEVAGSVVMGAKYRLASTNFDMTLGNTTSTATSANYLARDIGNASQLNDLVVDFTLKYLTGKGFIFTLVKPGTTPTTYNQAWGTFSAGDIPAGVNQSSALLNSIAPNRAYNGLRLDASVNNASGDYMAFSNLVFSQSTTDGSALVNSTVNNPGSYTQYILAGVNLASFDWTLSGKLKGKGATNGGDRVKFEFSARSYNGVSFVPEPSTFAIAALGGLAFLGYSLRRRVAVSRA